MHGEYKLSDEQSPLAFNDLLCLHLRFDDVWFRALYKCDHLVTFSLRGLAWEAHSRRLCEKAQGAGREGGWVGVFLKRTHASEGCSLLPGGPRLEIVVHLLDNYCPWRSGALPGLC